MEPQGRYWYNHRSHRYHDRANRNRFVAWQTVAEDLYRTLDRARDQGRDLGRALREGRITLAQYEADMMALIKNTHAISGALASGGWDRMSPADWGRVGAEVRRQYEFLRARVQAIEDGRQPLDGTLDRRSAMYGEASIRTFDRMLRAALTIRGFDEALNVLDPQAEHCTDAERPGCFELTEAGWMPVDEMPFLGDRQCLTQDRCTVAYRNSQTGEVVT